VSVVVSLCKQERQLSARKVMAEPLPSSTIQNVTQNCICSTLEILERLINFEVVSDQFVFFAEATQRALDKLGEFISRLGEADKPPKRVREYLQEEFPKLISSQISLKGVS
jgi:hypothetical protein